MVDHEGGVTPGDLPQSYREAVLVHPMLDADDGDPELVEVAGLLRHEVGPPQLGRLEGKAADRSLGGCCSIFWSYDLLAS